MKKLGIFFGNGFLLFALFLLLIIAVFNISKLFSNSSPKPMNVSLSDDYPPPDNTPVSDSTPIPTRIPTFNPKTPVPPPDWPTEEPWPPVIQTLEMPTQAPTTYTYPTPEFNYLDSSVDDSDLQSLWYPRLQAQDASVILEQVLVNNKGYRKEKPKAQITLDMQGNSASHHLLALRQSPDSELMVVNFAFGDLNVVQIFDLAHGTVLPVLKDSPGQVNRFFDWAPDSRLALVDINDDAPSVVAQIDVMNSARKNIEYPEWEGVQPEIVGMAFSPDGNTIVDSAVYSPVFDKNHSWTTEIGLWEVKEFSTRRVLCRIENGLGIYPDSLKWSSDGKKVMWVLGQEVPGKAGWDLSVWVVDINSKNCNKLLHVGFTSNFIPGKFVANWSPDNNSAVVTIDEELPDGKVQNYLAVLDIGVGKITQLTEPTEDTLSNAQFSSDGQYILYSIQKGSYGEIWMIKADRTVSTPIAGPTTPNAPFELRLQK